MRLAGKTALVTAAGQGIGFAAQLYVYKMFLLHNHKEN